MQNLAHLVHNGYKLQGVSTKHLYYQVRIYKYRLWRPLISRFGPQLKI